MSHHRRRDSSFPLSKQIANKSPESSDRSPVSWAGGASGTAAAAAAAAAAYALHDTLQSLYSATFTLNCVYH